MRIISFFIVLFVIVSYSTCLYANHSYYCNCNPPATGSCQCNSLTGNITLMPGGAVGFRVSCTAPGAVIPATGEPPVFPKSYSVSCTKWTFSANHLSANAMCINKDMYYPHYVSITGFYCTKGVQSHV